MEEQFILKIMEKFSNLNMAALELTVENTTICLQKDAAFAPTKIVQHGNPGASTLAAVPQFQGTLPQIPATPAPTAVKTEKLSGEETLVKSPIVGTFYRSPSPDAPSYAQEGKTIKKGQPLCILEAMKMMNTLEAEYDCVIEKILVVNGDLVEFDQPLFQVHKI